MGGPAGFSLGSSGPGRILFKSALNLWFLATLTLHVRQLRELLALQEFGDFIAFLTAGRLAQSGAWANLYNLETQKALQEALPQYRIFLPYYHPPFEALLFWPLAYLSDFQAYLAWFAGNLAMAAAALYVLIRAAGPPALRHAGTLALGALSFFPLAVALAQGQDSILLLLLLTLAHYNLQRGCDGRAGILYALALFKPHIIAPFILALIAGRRGRTLLYFAVTALGLLLLSLALVGSHGAAAYLAILKAVSGAEGLYGSFPHLMPNLRGLWLRGLGPGTWPQVLFLATSGVLLLAVWRVWRTPSPAPRAFDLRYALTTVAAVLGSFHLHAHDLVLLTLPLLLVVRLGLAEGGSARLGVWNLWVATGLVVLLAPFSFIVRLDISVLLLAMLAVALGMEAGRAGRAVPSPDTGTTARGGRYRTV